MDPNKNSDIPNFQSDPDDRARRVSIIDSLRVVQSETYNLEEMAVMQAEGAMIDRNELAKAQDNRLSAMRQLAGLCGIQEPTDRQLLDELRDNNLKGILPPDIRDQYNNYGIEDPGSGNNQ